MSYFYRALVVCFVFSLSSPAKAQEEARLSIINKHLDAISDEMQFRTSEAIMSGSTPIESLKSDVKAAMGGSWQALEKLEDTDYNLSCKTVGTGGGFRSNQVIPGCCIAAAKARDFFKNYSAGLPENTPDSNEMTWITHGSTLAALYKHVRKLADSNYCSPHNRHPWYKGGGNKKH